MALKVYRTTPLGRSPQELLFGKKLKANILRGAYETTLEEFKKKDKNLKNIRIGILIKEDEQRAEQV